MDDPGLIDLCDRRGRLRRLAAAALIGLLVTIPTMLGVVAVAREPNPDPVARSSVFLLGIAVFVVITKLAAGTLEAIARRRGGAPKP